MGCWNGTCMISQLPIFNGNEVALIFIKMVNKNLIALDSCNPNKYFLPYPCIVYGNYDDYGAIENVTGDVDIMYEIIEKELNICEDDVRNLCDKWYGGYKNKEKANAYLRYVQNSDRPELGNNESFGFVLIHKALFELFTTKYTNNAFYFMNKDQILNDLEKKITDNKFIPFNSNTIIFDDIQLTSVNKKSISDIISINSALLYLRKLWFPQTGAGSQMDLTDYQKLLNEFYNNFIEEYDKKFEEEY